MFHFTAVTFYRCCKRELVLLAHLIFVGEFKAIFLTEIEVVRLSVS